MNERVSVIFVVAMAMLSVPAMGQLAAVPATQPASDDLTSLSIDQLMNVEVSSPNKHEEPLADAPGAVTVISEEDIARSGLDSIPELLRLVPGMDVARMDANSWAISSRGLNNLLANKLEVISDGRTDYDQNFAGVYWDAQDYVLQDLNRIEVINGPGASLWGANAVNGVVNIVTKPADATQGLLASSTIGTDGENVSVRYGGQLDGDTYWRAYAKLSTTENFKNPDGSDANDGWQSMRSGFRVDHYGTPEDTLTLEGDTFTERAGQTNDVPTFAAPNEALIPTTIDASGVDLISRWTHVSDPTSDFALQFYYDRYNRDEYVLDSSIDTFDSDFHDRFPLGDQQELTWGGGARLTLIDDVSTSSVVVNPGAQQDYLINQFVQDDVALVPDRLHFFAGTKLEENNLTGLEVQPSARLLWTPNKTNSIWGAVSRAVRTPSVGDRDTFFVESRSTVAGTPVETDLVPNSDFGSEEMMSYELGYRAELTDAFSVDVNGYYDHYDQLSDFLVGAPTFVTTPFPHVQVPLTQLNNASGPIYGGEVAASWKVEDDWRLTASYTLTQSHIRSAISPVTAEQANGTVPVNQFQFHSDYNLTKDLEFNTGTYYYDRLTYGNVPAFVRLDLGMTWRPRQDLELSAGVQNLLDNHHQEFSNQGGFVQNSEIPRNFYGQVTIKF
ncbi:MAG: TonB-dependent receptor [Tepidisphaeraceae bacterium]|jgi:iron complex outermembrane receptor protein